MVDNVDPLLKYLNSNHHQLRQAKIYVCFLRCGGYWCTVEIVPLKEFLECIVIHDLTISEGRCEFQKLKPPYPYSNMVVLSLMFFVIEGDPMDCLGKLSNLEDLKFLSVTLVDKTIICGANSFPKLKFLMFFMVDFENWIVFQVGLSKLSDLDILDFSALKEIPEELRFVNTLSELKIGLMPSKFKQGILEKFCHVPTISMD